MRVPRLSFSGIFLSFLHVAAGVALSATVDNLYRQHCATCHGAALEGGQGGSLVGREWVHGGTPEDLAKSIALGFPESGMPAFDESLTPQEIRALVVYLREKQSQEFKAANPMAAVVPGKPVQTDYATYKMEPIVLEGLEAPWSLAFLPDGRKLVTEKPGRLRILNSDWSLESQPVVGTPQVVTSSQGGLLEVAPGPDVESSGWIYLTYAAPPPVKNPDPKASMTKVVRGRVDGNQWVDEETIFEADPRHYSNSGVHFGSRIVFDGEHLYISLGERGASIKAQEISAPNGKILRLFPDGKIPSDNPFASNREALGAIWSYGHRNPQGLVVDPRDHSIYATEHGPRGGDEFNLIRKGANYGWPLVCFGMNYNGTPLTAETEMHGVDAPMHHWTPSIATCGLAFYDGDRFPEWKNDFFVGGLKGGLHRLRLQEGKVIEDEVIFDESVGRVRDVRSGPDGYLYVVLNKPDRIIRLVPAVSGGWSR